MIVEEVTDQQGRGSNGWDCGPITFSNIKNYLEFITGSKTHLEFTVGAYNEENHATKIEAIRSADIVTYARVAGISVDQQRAEDALSALVQEGKNLLEKAKIVSESDLKLREELAKLDAFYLSILFEALESNRLLAGLSSKELYSALELKNAYQIVEAEVVRASNLNSAANQQPNSHTNNNANYPSKNFKVNQANFDYYHKLLNHFELLAKAAGEGNLNISTAMNLSFSLNNELTEQVIGTSNAELLLAGLMSLEIS